MIREKRFHATAHPRDPLWTMGDAPDTLVVVAPAPAAAPGLAVAGSLTIAALKKVVVSICNDDADSLELGTLDFGRMQLDLTKQAELIRLALDTSKFNLSMHPEVTRCAAMRLSMGAKALRQDRIACL